MDIRVGTISSPRISPIRRRCRECRNDAGNRSAIDISPAGRPLGPVSPVPGRASMGTNNGYRGLVTPSALVSKILCKKVHTLSPMWRNAQIGQHTALTRGEGWFFRRQAPR